MDKKTISQVILLTLLILVISSTFLKIVSFANPLETSEPFEVDSAEVGEAINDFKDEINKISNIMLAFSAISSVLIFIIHFIRLAAAYNHPIIRHKVLVDLMISGICTAGIGAFGLIFKLYIGIFM